MVSFGAETTHLGVILQVSLFTKLEGCKCVENGIRRRLSAPRLVPLLSLCIPTSKVHPTLVIAMQHAVRVHHFCNKPTPEITRASKQQYIM